MAKTMLGISYGVYNGNPWGKIHYFEPAESRENTFNLGYTIKSKKCSYSLCVELAKEWNKYEMSEINVYFGEHDRIDRVELAG